MLLTRKHPKAGRRLVEGSYTVEEDRDTGHLGYRLGYCPKCAEKILLSMREARLVANQFAYYDNRYQQLVKKIKPKIPIRLLIARWLVSRMPEREVIGDI